MAMNDPDAVPAATSPQANGHAGTVTKAGYLGLVIGSVGIVYGDIGTSPLYAFRVAVTAAAGGGMVGRPAVIGLLSLIIWALLLVVTVKYVVLLLRADNNGEGGTLALMALAQRSLGRSSKVILLFGLIGAALFYGDAMITPALSVLSAVEGLKIATPALEPFVVPIALVILIGLFAVQSYGTARVSAWFGPITLLWFLALAAGGAIHLFDDPGVLAAFNPYYGAQFIANNGWIALFTLGAVVLVVTGAESLYADLGHFGRKPIRDAWFWLVLPSLLLNYLGQGALVLSDPVAINNPFYFLYPEWALLPMIVLATCATVVASQAVITGAYSLAQQAIQLGLLPRLEVRHTSATHYGQIYVARVNWFLLLGVVLLVGIFHTSSALATAYGIAVTGTMFMTTLMAGVVVRRVWKWNWFAIIALLIPLGAIDLIFLGTNLFKFYDGGWAPIGIAALIMLITLTWRRGARQLFDKTRRQEVPLEPLVKNLEKKQIHRVPGTAVFLTSDPENAPTALLHSLKHYKVLHEHNVILTVVTANLPRVPQEERVELEAVSQTFSRVKLNYGFMESPNIPKALAIARKLGWTFDIMSTSFFLSRRTLRPAKNSLMPRWQDKLFIALVHSSDDATNFFQIPSERVVEVGTQVAI
ncbi:MAG: potassium transporter Kup [Xanthobacteraceae bacterium]|nr:potassium transporter Kup [Xanthobacteraceae bacterium]QYK43819.1 MAG: potassium transporter Kup [Xanthobacteraceae bacterium]